MNETLHNLTNIDVSTPVDFLTWLNETMLKDLLGVGLLLSVFVITFANLREYPAIESFTASSFVSMITAVLLFIVGLVGETVMMITIAATVLSTIILALTKNDRGIR